MVGLRADMLHLVLPELQLEARLATPVRVLPAVVGQHLLRNAILRTGLPVHLEHMLRSLRGIQAKAHEVAAVVVHEADQVHLLARKAEAHDVRLPHLVRCRTLEEPGFGGIVLANSLGWRG